MLLPEHRPELRPRLEAEVPWEVPWELEGTFHEASCEASWWVGTLAAFHPGTCKGEAFRASSWDACRQREEAQLRRVGLQATAS